MAAAARQARTAAPAPRREVEARPKPAAAAYRAPRARRQAAQRSRLTRAFVTFVACLTVLAVGRVALSFAVVQKTLQTDAVVREQQSLANQNGQLEGSVSRLGSPVFIRHIAESQLGLEDATHVLYLRPLARAMPAEVAATR